MAIIIFGLYALGFLISGSIMNMFLSTVLIPIVLLSTITVMILSAVFMAVASGLVLMMSLAVVSTLALITIGIAIPIAAMILASAVSVALLLALSAGIGLIALILILFALSLFNDDKDFIDTILDFLKGTAIYEWYLREVKAHGGFGGYLRYQFNIFLNKIEKLK